MTQETAKRCISILEQLSLTPQLHDNASSSTAHLPKKKNEGEELTTFYWSMLMNDDGSISVLPLVWRHFIFDG